MYNILVCDDDKEIVNAIEIYLEKEGYQIYKAYNGFTDDYSGSRYKPVTDNMYTEVVTGYIEK